MATKSAKQESVSEESSNKNGAYHETISNRMREQAHSFIDKTADQAESIEANLGSRAELTAEQLSEKREQLEAEFKTQYAKVRTKASENPLLTLGIVFAAGALIGRAVSKR